MPQVHPISYGIPPTLPLLYSYLDIAIGMQCTDSQFRVVLFPPFAGDFEVKANSQLIYSKQTIGAFPDPFAVSPGFVLQ